MHAKAAGDAPVIGVEPTGKGGPDHEPVQRSPFQRVEYRSGRIAGFTIGVRSFAAPSISRLQLRNPPADGPSELLRRYAFVAGGMVGRKLDALPEIPDKHVGAAGGEIPHIHAAGGSRFDSLDQFMYRFTKLQDSMARRLPPRRLIRFLVGGRNSERCSRGRATTIGVPSLG